MATNFKGCIQQLKFLLKREKQTHPDLIYKTQMIHSEFKIGLEFVCGGNTWRCTDVGTRVIIAIQKYPPDDTTKIYGPPYSIAEHVFDEYDLPACSLSE